MRDRGKRRKQQPEKPGQENPAPLQPKFPDLPSTKSRASSPSSRRSPRSRKRNGIERISARGRQRGALAAAGDGETVRAAVAVAVAAIVRRPLPRRQRCPGPEARPVRPLKLVKPVNSSSRRKRLTARSAQPSRKPKGAVVLSIGLPGSGKSTWFKRHNILPLSSDMVRILLFDDVTEQRYQDLVFSTLRAMLRARLLARRPWNYVDATNLSPHERRSWVKLAHDFGYEAHAVFFDVPPEVCIERNRRRERNVPEDVMQRMASKLRPPKFEEGFAKITVVRLKGKGEGNAAPEEPRQELPIEPDEGGPPSVADVEN